MGQDKPKNDAQARGVEDLLLGALSRRALDRKVGQLPPASDLDDDLILRYVDGAVSASERETVERHFLIDRDAKERVGILAGAFDAAGISREVAAPEGALTRAGETVSRYVFHVADGFLDLLRGNPTGHALAPASVRGASAAAKAPSGFQIDREFATAQGALSAHFELHAERADVDAGALADLVVHVDLGGKPVEGVRCKLLRDGRAIDSREVEAVGCTFNRLTPARYDIELRKGGVELGRVLFDLRG
jgi:hypothetical protein